MDTDTSKATIAELMAKVMGDVQAVGKDDRNNQQGYNFRGIDAVVNAVGPVLRKHGVVPMPHKTVALYRDVQTSTGKPSRECTVTVTYRFYGPAGDFLEAEVPGESMDFGDKGAPKAMSVAYRILLLQALCIPTDEPEPDARSYERGRDERPPAAPARPAPQASRPPAELSEADALRAEIKALAGKQTPPWNLETIAQGYAKEYPGRTLKGETDPEPIRLFLGNLRADAASAGAA